MSRHFFRTRPTIVLGCVLALMIPQPFPAITNSGYGGTTITGRTSIAIVDAPGGTRVNTFLGTVILPRTDLRIPGRGLPLDVQFTYNSNQNGMSSPFGYGWAFSYGLRCLLSASRSVVVQWGNGRNDLFVWRGGTYTPVNEGVFAALQQIGSTLQITTKERIQYIFDSSQGLLQQIRDPNGNALTFSRVGGQLTAITDAAGRHILLTYDAKGHLTTITDPNSSPARVLQYAYDLDGNQISFTDPLGAVTRYTYDTGHRLTQIQDALGITAISYSGPNSTVASIARLAPNQTIVSQRSFSYDPGTQTTMVTDLLDTAHSAATSYQYDAHRRLVQTTDPLGHIEKRTYDANGNTTSITNRNGNPTLYTYDSIGNLLTRTDALGNTTTFTYDGNFSRVASSTDANHHTTTFAYDSSGNLTTMQDPLGNTTRYTHDAMGQLVLRQNARGSLTTFTYDAFGNRTGITDSLSRSRHFTYDAVGNAVSQTDARGNTTTYAYDALSRVTRVAYSDFTQASFSYDSAGALISAIDPNTNQTFAYDANGQMIQATDNRASKGVSYQYDGRGNRVQMTGPEGSSITYSYDLDGRLVSLTRNSQLFRFAHDNDNRVTKVSLPNGTTTTRIFDTADHLLSLVNQRSNGTVVSSYSYLYDNAGNRTRLMLPGGDVINYSYDAWNQLVREIRNGALTYDRRMTYDAAGNRTLLDANGVTTTYGYDPADQLGQETTGGKSVLYDYDLNGNRALARSNGNTSSYTYDVRDRLIAFRSPTTQASYTYDVLDRRIGKTAGSITTKAVFDGRDAVAEYDGNGVLQAEYLFGKGFDEPLAKLVGSDRYFYLSDGLGSITNIVNGGESVLNTYDYDAFGTIAAKVEQVNNNYTFAAREFDGESGLYYFRARMYDPLAGRFTQADPYDNNSGKSAYMYVDNSPLNLLDPGGLNDGDELDEWTNRVIRVGGALIDYVLDKSDKAKQEAERQGKEKADREKKEQEEKDKREKEKQEKEKPPTPPPPKEPDPGEPPKKKTNGKTITITISKDGEIKIEVKETGSNDRGCTGSDAPYASGTMV